MDISLVPSHRPSSANHSSDLSEISEPDQAEIMSMTPTSLNCEEDGNDTEAETERIEVTPHKYRQHRDLILIAGATNVSEADEEVTGNDMPATRHNSTDLGSGDDQHESNGGNSSRKRKLQSTEGIDKLRPLVTQGRERSSLQRATNDPQNSFNLSHAKMVSRSQMSRFKQSEADTSHIVVGSGTESPKGSPHRREEPDNSSIDGELGNLAPNEADEEDDMLIRTEAEVARKKCALESLTSLEQGFAKLKDRLFSERIALANKELALLQNSSLSHPELAAMRVAVDQHRQHKINYQKTRLKYKFATLQRESISRKRQIQGQYMQTSRELRDRHLCHLNQEYYLVQRERRSGQPANPTFNLTMAEDRSSQIALQRSYNLEVSILSGVARHVGFPAAPRLQSAKSLEILEDLSRMGISVQQTSESKKLSGPRKNIATMISVPRLSSSLEEDAFLQRNAWANPQHPVHQQQRQQKGRALHIF